MEVIARIAAALAAQVRWRRQVSGRRLSAWAYDNRRELVAGTVVIFVGVVLTMLV